MNIHLTRRQPQFLQLLRFSTVDIFESFWKTPVVEGGGTQPTSQGLHRRRRVCTDVTGSAPTSQGLHRRRRVCTDVAGSAPVVAGSAPTSQGLHLPSQGLHRRRGVCTGCLHRPSQGLHRLSQGLHRASAPDVTGSAPTSLGLHRVCTGCRRVSAPAVAGCLPRLSQGVHRLSHCLSQEKTCAPAVAGRALPVEETIRVQQANSQPNDNSSNCQMGGPRWELGRGKGVTRARW
jgi:hypothetical protein